MYEKMLFWFCEMWGISSAINTSPFPSSLCLSTQYPCLPLFPSRIRPVLWLRKFLSRNIRLVYKQHLLSVTKGSNEGLEKRGDSLFWVVGEGIVTQPYNWPLKDSQSEVLRSEEMRRTFQNLWASSRHGLWREAKYTTQNMPISNIDYWFDCF